MPSLNPKIVLHMLRFGFQGPNFFIVQGWENAVTAVSALLVFLAPVPEPKSSSRRLRPSPKAFSTAFNKSGAQCRPCTRSRVPPFPPRAYFFDDNTPNKFLFLE